MKKVGFRIVAIVLLLIMGCSKDELISDSSENNQLKKSNKLGITEIRFFSNYTDNNVYVVAGEGCLLPTRKILQQGTFSGTINGYGIINPKLSKYEINDCVIIPSDQTDNTNYIEPNMYKLNIKGTISLSQREYCSINITGNIYPRCFPDIQFDGGDFEGTGTIVSGVGKLVGLNNKIFRVYGRLFTSGVNDFKNGKINLILTDKIN